LAENLEPVADAEDRSSLLSELLHRRHDGTESRDGAGAQVVAIAEPARQHYRVGSLQIGLAMPDVVGFRTCNRRRPERIGVTVAAGKPHHRDSAHQASTSTR